MTNIVCWNVDVSITYQETGERALLLLHEFATEHTTDLAKTCTLYAKTGIILFEL